MLDHYWDAGPSQHVVGQVGSMLAWSPWSRTTAAAVAALFSVLIMGPMLSLLCRQRSVRP
jgi:hypothetical protein